VSYCLTRNKQVVEMKQLENNMYILILVCCVVFFLYCFEYLNTMYFGFQLARLIAKNGGVKSFVDFRSTILTVQKSERAFLMYHTVPKN